MIAIIPARGGSKGLPGKNIRLLAGKPLIAYTIEAAIKANSISRIIVSTDSKEISDISIKFGAECPFLRPSELAKDSSLAIDSYLYTIHKLEEIEKISIQEVIILLPTSPLRRSMDIENAISIFRNKNADSVISFCKEFHPIRWHKRIDNDGKLKDITDNLLVNRQEEETTYFPNGSIYIFKKELLQKNIYYSENSFAYIMDRKSSVDIDSIDDFEYAEFLLKGN